MDDGNGQELSSEGSIVGTLTSVARRGVSPNGGLWLILGDGLRLIHSHSLRFFYLARVTDGRGLIDKKKSGGSCD